jgi:AraC family transcriptional regulator
VLIHIQQHLDDALPLDDLAALACFSPYHFHRIFKGMVGESVKEHVRRLRLERAAGQLKLGSSAVSDIAQGAGYESHEAFTRSFKAVFGMPPLAYRTAKSVAAVRAPSGVHYRPGDSVEQFRTLRPGGAMNVQTKHIEPLRLAFLRHVGPYGDVSAAWDRLLPELGKDGWLGGDTQFLGICHDDPDVTPEGKIRYDACVTVDDAFVAGGDIGVQVVAGGDYAVTTHIGPYDQLGRTYGELLGQWLPRSGRELRDAPCFEVYLNDPQSAAPSELLTDIYAPLA